MSTKKDNRILGIQRDKLIVALTMEDAVAGINLAMRVRKMKFTLDFTHKDHLARLYASMPGCEPEGIFVANPRTKIAYRVNPGHPDLRAAIDDIHERLAKLDAGMYLAAEKPPNQKPIAKVQMRVKGSREVVLTLMECTKGRIVHDEAFKLPDGRVP